MPCFTACGKTSDNVKVDIANKFDESKFSIMASWCLSCGLINPIKTDESSRTNPTKLVHSLDQRRQRLLEKLRLNLKLDF